MVLTSAWVFVGGQDGASGSSTGGDFGGDGWVWSGNITPLSCGFLDVVVLAPTRSAEWSSWVWVKSALGVENSTVSVLMSLCTCKIPYIIVASSGLLYKILGEFSRNST